MFLPLSKEEAQVLLNMVNIAVQAKGLEAAEAGLLFVRKIQLAQQVEDNPPLAEDAEK
jgi:uncharacterized protein YneF (UPF0154 family)